MSLDIEAQYLVIYSENGHVKINNFDNRVDADQRFYKLSLDAKHKYVTLLDFVQMKVDMSIIPVADLKLRESLIQKQMFDL